MSFRVLHPVPGTDGLFYNDKQLNYFAQDIM